MPHVVHYHSLYFLCLVFTVFSVFDLTGYHALAGKHDRPDDDEQLSRSTKDKKTFDMPELLHNLDMLVEMSEEAILDSDRKYVQISVLQTFPKSVVLVKNIVATGYLFMC